MVAFYSFLGILLQGVIVNLLLAYSPTEGQNLRDIKITVNVNKITLQEAIEEIEKNSNFNFLYSGDEIPINEIVTIDVTGESLYEVLKGLAGQYGLVFQRINNQVVVKKSFNMSEERIIIEENGIIKGRVISATTQEPLIGANIILKSTSIGTTTNENGEFTILNIAEGTYDVEVRYLGYNPELINVTVVSNKTIQLEEIFLTTANFGLDEIIVAANLVAMERRAIPSGITTINSEQLDALPINNISGLFRGLIPGGSAWDPGPENNFTSVNLRGTNSFGGNTVKTYIDGVEVADALWSAAIDLNSIERVEVLRGPQASTLFGSDASGGVLQLFTKKGSVGDISINAKISSGIIESKYVDDTPIQQDYSLRVSGGVQGITYNLGGTFFKYDPYVLQGNLDRTSLSGGVRITQNLFTVDFSAQYSKQNYGSSGNPILRDEGITNYLFPINNNNSLEEQTFALNIGYVPTDWWQHNLTIGLDENEFLIEKTEPRRITPADTLLILTNVTRSKPSIRYYSTFRFPVGDLFTSIVTAGFDHNKYTYTSSQSFDIPIGKMDSHFSNGVYVGKSEYANTGFFGQWLINVSNTFFLTSGIRAETNDNFGDDYGTAVSPRIGASYTLEPGFASMKLRASYGKGIKPPSQYAKIGDVQPYLIRVANPNIGPEQQVGFDFGVDMYFGDGLASLEATYYDQTAKDLIDFVNTGFSGFIPIYQYQNVGEIKNKGIELSGSLNADPVQINFTFTITSSKVEKLGQNYSGDLQLGDDLLGIPKQSGGITITYKVPQIFSSNINRGGSISLGAVYFGDWTEIDAIALNGFYYKGDPYRGSGRAYWMSYPSFVKLQLNMEYALSKNIDFFINIQNLLNRQEPEKNNTTIQAGRITMAGIRINY